MKATATHTVPGMITAITTQQNHITIILPRI